MSAFDLLNIADARAVAEHLLRSEDQSLGSSEALKDPKAVTFDKPVPIPDLKIGAKLTLAGSLELRLFNEKPNPDKKIDIDEAGIYGKVLGKAPEPPYIAFDDKIAWLRYSASIKGDLSGGAKIPVGGWANLGIELSAEGAAELRAYRPHKKTEALLEAVRDDFTDFRTLLSLPQLLSADDGEVHVLAVNGALKTKITFSLADLVPAALQNLATTLDFLPGRPKFALSLSTGLKATASLALSAGFELIVFKASEDVFRVSLRKSRANTTGAEGALGVDAKVTLDPLVNAAELDVLKTKILAEFFDDMDLTELDELKEKALEGISWNSLPASWQKIATKAAGKLAGKLKDTVVPDNLQSLVARIDDIRKKIEEALIKGVEKTFSFGISIAWSRVETHETLAQGDLTTAELRNIHGQLLRLETTELRKILAAKSTAGEGVVFLDTDTLLKASRLTLGLDLGFFALKQETKRSDKLSIATNLNGLIKPSYAVELSLEKCVIKENTGSHVALTSVLKDFLPSDQVTVRSFAHSLQLGLEFGDKNASFRDIREYVDTAALWGGLDPSPAVIDATIDKIKKWKGEIGGKFEIAASLSVSPQALAILWPVWPSDEQTANALAAAMGPADDSYIVLQDIAQRTELFAPIWSWVARQTPGDFRDDAGRKKLAGKIAWFAQAHLKSKGHRLLGNLEHAANYLTTNHNNPSNHYPRPNRAMASTLVNRVDNLTLRLHQVRKLGFELVTSDGTDWRTHFAAVGDHFLLLRYDPFFTRFYGRLLHQLAQSVPAGGNLLKVSLVATATPAKGDKQVLVIA